MSVTSLFQNALKQDINLAVLFESRASVSEQALGFVQQEKLIRLTYPDLLHSARSRAAAMQQKGFKAGQIALICCDEERTLIELFWAVQLVGGVAVPLSTPMSYSAQDETVQKLLSVYEQCPEAVVLTDLPLEALNRLETWRTKISQDVIWHSDSLESENIPLPVPRQMDDLAMLMFSSGSTGDPKGVCLTHRNLLTNLAQIAERSELTWHDKSLSWLPLTHDMGMVLFHICHTLATLTQFKMSAFSFVREPEKFLFKVSQLGISILGMPNFGFDLLLRNTPRQMLGSLDLSSVRLIYNGAEPIDPVLVRRFYHHFASAGLKGGVISPGYGIAEACVTASQFPQHDLLLRADLPSLWVRQQDLLEPGAKIHLAESNEEQAREIVSLGPVMPGMTVRVLDDHGQELTELSLGHVELSGPNVSNGYWGREAQDGCRSGDLGFVYRSEIFLTGRNKDILFINGANHFSNDLENRLVQHLNWPANQLAVVGFTDAESGREQVVIFYRADKQQGSQSGEMLKRELEIQLAYPVAAAIKLAALPKTTSGKIRRFQLRQALIRGDYEAELQKQGNQNQTPLSESEQLIWQQVSEILFESPGHPDSQAPLACYGMDSVGFAQLSHRLHTRFGIDLPLSTLMQAATLDRIANLLPQQISEVQEIVEESGLTSVPLSMNQHMIWTSYLLEQDKASYNENYSLHFNAKLNAEAFIQAVERAVLHHPMLCVRVDDHASPSLCLNSQAPVNVEYLDLRTEPQQVESLMNRLGRTPFDLRNESPIRLRLFQLKDREFAFFISANHLIIDGWSFNVLIQDVFSEYMQAQVPPINNMGLWKQEEAKEDEKSREHWKMLLDGIQPVRLPTDDHVNKQRGECLLLEWVFTPNQTQQIEQAALSLDSSLFSLNAALLSLLLSRISQVTKPVIGTLVANRHHLKDATRVGYFAQTQPLSLDVNRAKVLKELIEQVQEQLHWILQRPALSLEQISQLTDVNVTDFIHFVYVHQNAPVANLPGQVQVIEQKTFRSTSRTDLYVTSEMRYGNLLLCWEYDSARFSEKQIRYYAELYESLLIQLCTEPQQSLAELNWITPYQKKILNLYCDTALEVELDFSISARFNRASIEFADLPALSDEEQTYSYRQLKNAVNVLSQSLLDVGVKRGDRVCLLTERSANYVIALLATLQVGAVFVPIDPTLPQERISLIVNDCGADLLLTTPQVSLAKELLTSNRLLSFDSEQLKEACETATIPVNGQDGAYLIYTSGSTGRPKGVFNDHKSLANLVQWVAKDFAYHAGENICQFAPFSFDVSIAEILPSLCAGLHVYVLPSERRNSPQEYLEVLKKQRVNVATVTPAFFYHLLDDPVRARDCLASLRLFILGGEALNTEEVKRFQLEVPHVRLVNVYGPTETTVLSSFYFVPNPPSSEKAWQPLGLPIANTEIFILDEHRKLCPLTQTGEIYISGAGLSRGYWHDEPKTQNAFLTISPYGKPARRFYKTGDLGRLNINGELEFVGRADNQIKLRGFRIELGEIEDVLESHPALTQAVVLPTTLNNGQTGLVAYYCGDELDKTSLNNHLRQRLPEYMLIDFYRHLEKMPLTHNRKVDKKQLPALDLDTMSRHDIVEAPLGDCEQALAVIWREVLKVEAIGRHDSFFDLGGNSLSAARLVYRVREKFQSGLSLSDFLVEPSLACMAKSLDNNVPGHELHLQKYPAQNDYPASEAQVRMLFTQLNADDIAINNIPLTMALSAPLDAACLQSALKQLMARHPILCCRFELGEQGVRQYFDLPAKPDFTVHDVSHDGFLLEDLRAFLLQPLDPYQGPMWRVQLRRHQDDRQWLSMSIHHAIADGVTISLLLSELDNIIRGLSLPSMDEQPHYGDYCLWQQNHLEQGGYRQAEQYWQERLPKIQTLNLPLKSPHDTLHHGEQFIVALPESLGDSLQELCRKQNLSPFSLLLSAFAYLLGERCKQSEFSIGVTLSGRSFPDLEQMPGLFVNTLPLSLHPRATVSLIDNALSVQHSSAALLEVQDYPLNRVQKLSECENGLFNVLFNQEVLPECLTIGGELAELVGVSTDNAKFPLLISFITGKQLCWRVEYQLGQLDRDWVNSLQRDVCDLLEHFAEMPDTPVNQLSELNQDILALLDLD